MAKGENEMGLNKDPIYIVDDDESVCRALKVMLVSLNFEVRTFFSAEEFFSAVPNSEPGCLILDLHLPGLNGWQAQQRLLKTGSKRPVIIITADKNDRLGEMVLKSGATKFLQKPFQDFALIDAINSALKSGMSANKNNDLVSI